MTKFFGMMAVALMLLMSWTSIAAAEDTEVEFSCETVALVYEDIQVGRYWRIISSTPGLRVVSWWSNNPSWDHIIPLNDCVDTGQKAHLTHTHTHPQTDPQECAPFANNPNEGFRPEEMVDGHKNYDEYLSALEQWEAYNANPCPEPEDDMPDYRYANGEYVIADEIDLNCDDLSADQKPVEVLTDDPWGLDVDNDGVGCE